MAVSTVERSDEWKETNEILNNIFHSLVQIDQDTRSSNSEKFERAEEWIIASADKLSALRLTLSNDTLPRFEQSLRTRMAIYWKIDQARRDEITAINAQPRTRNERGRTGVMG